MQQIWMIEPPDPDDLAPFEPKVESFAAADLTPLLRLVEGEVRAMAAVAGMPYELLLGPDEPAARVGRGEEERRGGARPEARAHPGQPRRGLGDRHAHRAAGDGRPTRRVAARGDPLALDRDAQRGRAHRLGREAVQRRAHRRRDRPRAARLQRRADRPHARPRRRAGRPGTPRRGWPSSSRPSAGSSGRAPSSRPSRSGRQPTPTAPAPTGPRMSAHEHRTERPLTAKGAETDDAS